MGKNAVKQIDEAMALELGLTLSQFTLTIKHVQQLHRLIRGFVFAYTKDDLVCYDTAILHSECNGKRIRLPKFEMHPTVHKQIAKHHYKRWFVYCDSTLYPVQLAKPSILDDSFLFTITTESLHRSKIAYAKESLFIRKKPLVVCRPVKNGWGCTSMTRRRELLEAV